VADGNKFLLGKARNTGDDRNGTWCFPGGGIKKGERPEKAAERECSEETGITCKADQGALPHRDKPGVAFVVCKRSGGKLKPNHEFEKLDWFTREEAMALPDIYQVNKTIIMDVL
jgi:8-oxo-dGTP pyrophosphatase MutT (NUDIX family)